jgi:hypothetical protein
VVVTDELQLSRSPRTLASSARSGSTAVSSFGKSMSMVMSLSVTIARPRIGERNGPTAAKSENSSVFPFLRF